MRPAVVLRANLAAGCGLLAWVLYRFGGPTLGIVTAQASPARLAGLACVAATVVVTFAWRLELAGLGPPLGLGALALYRAAGESLAALVPSARIGGDPLRAWLAERERVPPGHAIASVAVDRTLEMGAGAPFGVIFATVLVQHGIPGLQEALVTVSIGALALAVGIAAMVRRLRRGGGLVAALIRGPMWGLLPSLGCWWTERLLELSR